MSKTRWLSRRMGPQGSYLTLALNQKEFDRALRDIGVKEKHTWIGPRANASCWRFPDATGADCHVVSINVTPERNSIEIAGLLVHEAVHVWQNYCERIGEDSPGIEQEAYGIQAIAQELMAEFARRTA